MSYGVKVIHGREGVRGRGMEEKGSGKGRWEGAGGGSGPAR